MAAGTLSVTQDHLGATIGSAATTGDRKLKTFTFRFASLAVRAASSAFAFDFEVKATAGGGSAQPLCLSFARVITEPLESPPPPPFAPGSQFVTLHKTVVEMLAAGNVADYTEDTKLNLATKFVSLANVDIDAVEVEITPASVRIVVKITVANATAAAALVTSIGQTLSSAEAASAFTNLTITSTPTVSAVVETKLLTGAYPPPPPSGMPVYVAAIIAAVGGVCIFAVVIALAIVYRRRKWQPEKEKAALEGSTSMSPSRELPAEQGGAGARVPATPDPATGLQKV